MNGRVVVLLARAPSAPGKTRLTTDLSHEDARALREALLLDTLDRAAATRVPVITAFTPETARDEMACLLGPVPLLLQRGPDLGERMRNAMADAFHEGAGMVALIGTDLPSLPPEYINDAFTMLEHDADLVLGPADDGGFYLIASRAPLPPILDDIDWGTASVHAQVVAAAVDAGMTVGFARPWFDVDTPEELARVVSDSRSQNLNMRIRGTREIRR